MLDLSPADLSEVLRILRAHLPEYRVCAFGSRVDGTARRYSDLDLVVMSDKPLASARLSDLKEAFSTSNLPFMVDVLEWASLAESFRRIIEAPLITVQEVEHVEHSVNEPEHDG